MGMNAQEAAALLRSVGAVDQAKILEGGTQRPFQVQTLTLDLATAKLSTNPQKIAFPFKAIYVKAATDTSVTINMTPNSRDSYQSPVPLGLNDVLNFDYPISEAYLSWDAQSGKSITLIFFVDANFTSGKLISQTSGGLSVSEGTSFTRSVTSITGAAAATSLAPSNTSRTVTTIINDSTDYLYLGESSVTDAGATKGIPVAPGERFMWRNTAQLYGYMPVTGNVIVIHEVQ